MIASGRLGASRPKNKDIIAEPIDEKSSSLKPTTTQVMVIDEDHRQRLPAFNEVEVLWQLVERVGLLRVVRTTAKIAAASFYSCRDCRVDLSIL